MEVVSRNLSTSYTRIVRMRIREFGLWSTSPRIRSLLIRLNPHRKRNVKRKRPKWKYHKQGLECKKGGRNNRSRDKRKCLFYGIVGHLIIGRRRQVVVFRMVKQGILSRIARRTRERA